MSRRHKNPSYRLHRQSNQAIVTLVSPTGKRRDVLLGEFDSPASHAEYARVIGEWHANRRALPMEPAPDMSVNELIVIFWRFAEQHYRHPTGEPTGELANFRASFHLLKELYGRTMAASFGPLALKALRNRMIGDGLARRVINSRVGRIKHLFRHAVSEQLIPSSVYEGLRTVAALSRGRSDARETEPIKPVDTKDVAVILPHLNNQTRAMVELMRLTGMRPNEVCRMRPSEIDRSGPIWVYTPKLHKNAWRGPKHKRTIALGERAQAIIARFLSRAPDAPLFSPREALRQKWDDQREQRIKRKSKVFPCQQRDREKRLATISEQYTTIELNKNIYRACDRAGIARWSANRLRHLHGTEVRRQFGLEAASTALGHHHVSTTELYAEKNAELATAIAAKIG